MIWLVYYRNHAAKNRRFIEDIISKGKKAGVLINLKYADNLILDLNYEIQADRPKAVIARMINPVLSKNIESAGIKVFNNSYISYVCNNKALAYEMISELNIPIIPSLIISKVNNESRDVRLRTVLNKGLTSGIGLKEDLHKAQESKVTEKSVCKYDSMIEYIDLIKLNKSIQHNTVDKYVNEIFPEKPDKYVIKSVSGHGGVEVMTLEEYLYSNISYGIQERDAADYYEEKSVIQPLIQPVGRDLRVYVIGRKIIGSVLRMSNSGFKSNFSLGGNVRLYDLSSEQKVIVNNILNRLDFAYAGIDFLLDESDKLIFNEIEDVVGARMLSQCSDVDYVSMYINYILSNLE